jgi:hypothetical protein
MSDAAAPNTANTPTPLWPLSLADQLDAMLMGWLEHEADEPEHQPIDAATAVITVEESMVPELEDLCARWDLSIRPGAHASGKWSVLCVTGRPLPVVGLTEVIALLRRR